jgi:hypothetical protein
MARIGVSPNTATSRAVYISDLDEILNREANLPPRESNACYKVFSDETDPDHVQAAGNSGSSFVSVQQTRRRLGSHRHDLYVAARVVNSIEKELMQSAWEQWVAEEHRRCKLVEALVLDDLANLKERANDTAGTNTEVRGWYEEYCTSCGNEYQKVVRGTVAR